mmetsp:Transcript_35170/g.52516  ORF Transcript_35170/g.52516 Transcript_35170/m.52516 type:complete len:131 (-) Transcript_35170:645-1037(-)
MADAVDDNTQFNWKKLQDMLNDKDLWDHPMFTPVHKCLTSELQRWQELMDLLEYEERGVAILNEEGKRLTFPFQNLLNDKDLWDHPLFASVHKCLTSELQRWHEFMDLMEYTESEVAILKEGGNILEIEN